MSGGNTVELIARMLEAGGASASAIDQEAVEAAVPKVLAAIEREEEKMNLETRSMLLATLTPLVWGRACVTAREAITPTSNTLTAKD